MARRRGVEMMSLKTSYVLTLRGPLPADLSEKLSVAHAQAIMDNKYRVGLGDADQGGATHQESQMK